MHQRFVKEFVQTFLHVEVIILALHYPFTEGRYECHGAKVYALGGKNRRGICTFYIRRKAWTVLHRLMKSNEVVGLLSFWYGEAAMIAEKAARTHGVSHYTWLMGQDARSGNRYHKLLRMQGCRIIALSQSLQDEFFSNYGILPANIIAPGMDVLSNSGVHRDIDLLAVGSLIPLKQFDQFIQLVSKLRQQFPLKKVVLVGEGTEKTRLMSQAVELGVSDLVEFTGELSHAEVLKQMQRAKILVHPSSYEGFSGVCQEALAAGAWVVSYRTPSRLPVLNWHRADGLDNMQDICLRLLQTTFLPVPQSLGSMHNTVQKIGAFYPGLHGSVRSNNTGISAEPTGWLVNSDR